MKIVIISQYLATEWIQQSGGFI